MALGFFALTRLPLPEAITLNYAQPLLVVVFSALFLGETVRIYRWSAVVVGLVGVFIISWPKLTLFDTPGGDQQPGGGRRRSPHSSRRGISAVAMLLVRSLVHTEKTATIVLWFSLTASGVGAADDPVRLAGADACSRRLLLVVAGFCGGVAQILMTEAYRHAEASTVAPFEYTSMILGIVVGYLAFGDVPTIHMLVGGAIVVGAGIFIIWRERAARPETRRGAQGHAAPRLTAFAEKTVVFPPQPERSGTKQFANDQIVLPCCNKKIRWVGFVVIRYWPRGRYHL